MYDYSYAISRVTVTFGKKKKESLRGTHPADSARLSRGWYCGIVFMSAYVIWNYSSILGPYSQYDIHSTHAFFLTWTDKQDDPSFTTQVESTVFFSCTIFTSNIFFVDLWFHLFLLNKLLTTKTITKETLNKQ